MCVTWSAQSLVSLTITLTKSRWCASSSRAVAGVRRCLANARLAQRRSNVEANICTIANMIEEDKLYFAQMAGAPLMAILLAKHTTAPDVGYVVEEGAVAPNPSFPLPRMMLGSSRSHYRSAAWYGMNIVDSHAALGLGHDQESRVPQHAVRRAEGASACA